MVGKIIRWCITKIYPEKTLQNLIYTWDYQRDFFVSSLEIDFAVDVGANIGQWGGRFRKIRPNADILSFEPDLRCKPSLDYVSVKDEKWKVRYVGLSDSNSNKPLNLWDVEGGSTSFQKLTNVGEKFTGWLNASMGENNVSVCRLDTEISHGFLSKRSCLLKIDVQGYEMEVLRGCGELLKDFMLIEIEMPLVEIYSRSVSAGEIIIYLESHGFNLVSLATERWAYPGAADCDSLFVRSDMYRDMKHLK
jgi:FkbM family methyltransferase